MSILQRAFDPIRWSTENASFLAARSGFCVVVSPYGDGWSFNAFRTLPAECVYAAPYVFATRRSAQQWAERWLRAVSHD